jgi:hypothetical protein
VHNLLVKLYEIIIYPIRHQSSIWTFSLDVSGKKSASNQFL